MQVKFFSAIRCVGASEITLTTHPAHPFIIDLFLMSSDYSKWFIMADVPRIGINNPNVVKFGSMIEHTL